MEIEIRKATYLDWEFIRNWRNELKEGFVNQNYITVEEHEDFMIDQSQNYYIAEDNNGFSLGFVGVYFNRWHLDTDGDIRFCVLPFFAGKGIGTKMLQFIKEKYPQAAGKVKKDNIASNKAFEKAGYIQLYKDDNEFNYFLPLDSTIKCFNCSKIVQPVNEYALCLECQK